MTALLLSAFLQVGMLSGNATIYQPPKQMNILDLPCYATLGARADWGPLFAETSVRTDMQPASLTDWMPDEMAYSIGAGIEAHGVTLGIKHTCYHPVMPYMTYEGYKIVPSFEGATNDLYLRVEIGGKR